MSSITIWISILSICITTGATEVEDLLARFRNVSQLSNLPLPLTDDQTESMLFSICEQDDSREAKCFLENGDPDSNQTSLYHEMYTHARATLRLRLNNRAHCTAWLVGNEGHVLTNHHCIQTQWGANQTTLEAMAEGTTCAQNCQKSLACPGTVIHTRPLTFVTSGQSLQRDYTLFQLPEEDREVAVEKYGFLRLRRSGPVIGERIYVPQHPAGYGKRIAAHFGEAFATILDVDHDNGCGKNQVTYKGRFFWRFFE